MNQVPTNWCIVSTQKVTKMFLLPPIFDCLIPQRPNLLKRRFSSVGAPDPSQTTRRIKSTESGGSKRVFTICSSGETCCEEHSSSKLWVETKTNKKKHKTHKKMEFKKSLFDRETTPNSRNSGEIFVQVWRWFQVFAPHEKVRSEPSQPWSHLPHLGDRRPASYNHGCWFPWDPPPKKWAQKNRGQKKDSLKIRVRSLTPVIPLDLLAIFGR